MRGDLSETSVADLCRGLSDAESTGAVELEEPDGDARIFFRKGDVYWAVSPAPRARLGDRLVNAGLLSQDQLDQVLEQQRTATERTKLGALLVESGLVTRDVIRVFVQEQILDALFDLMRYHDGGYVFRPGEAADEKLPIDIPVDQLLVEVSRRQSEWDQIEAAIPDLDMVPDFVVGGSSANAALEPDEFAVLASVDGRRSIRDLAEDLGYSEFELARIVYGLTLLGIVDVRNVEDEEEPAPEDDGGELEIDLDDLVAAAEDGDDEDEDEDEDDEDEVDEDEIASALEEALAGDGPDPQAPAEDASPSRPRVKVHVDDDVTSYVAPRTVEPGREEADAPAVAASVSEVEEPRGEEAEVEEPAATETLAVEPEADEPGTVEPADLGPELDELDAWGIDEVVEVEPEPTDTVAPDLAPDDEIDEPDEPTTPDASSEPAPRQLDDADALAELTAVLASALGGEAADAPDTEPDEELTAAPPSGGEPLDDLEELGPDDDGPDDEIDEPEPWVASDADLGFFASTPGPTPEGRSEPETEPEPEPEPEPAPEPPRAPLDDADFDALLDQLAGAPEGSTDDAPPRPASPPESPVEPTRPTTPQPSPASSGRGTHGSGDVSEFLRELSRLALDETDAAPPTDEPGQEDDEDEPEAPDAASAADAAAAAREEGRRASAERRADDRNKKRGLFGWGR